MAAWALLSLWLYSLFFSLHASFSPQALSDSILIPDPSNPDFLICFPSLLMMSLQQDIPDRVLLPVDNMLIVLCGK